jgi:hypothetical protein
MISPSKRPREKHPRDPGFEARPQDVLFDPKNVLIHPHGVLAYPLNVLLGAKNAALEAAMLPAKTRENNKNKEQQPELQAAAFLNY